MSGVLCAVYQDDHLDNVDIVDTGEGNLYRATITVLRKLRIIIQRDKFEIVNCDESRGIVSYCNYLHTCISLLINCNSFLFR